MANVSLRDEAISLLAQFAQHDDANMLFQAIANLRQALSLEPSSHPDRPLTLNKLGCALKTQHDVSPDLSVLKEAIGYHRECLQYRPKGHENRIQTLNNLAIALKALRVSADDMDAGNEAIALLWEAITTHDFPATVRRVCSFNLRCALNEHYAQTSPRMQVEQLRALSVEQTLLVAELQSDFQEYAIAEYELARTLYDIADYGADVDETFSGLEKSIDIFRRLYTLYLHDPPSFPSEIDLLDVGNAFRKRFELKRDIDDIDFATMVLETLRAATEGVHIEASMSLAICLSSKFKVVPSLNLLDRAFGINESLLELPFDVIDIKDRAQVLHDKGFIQLYRFRHLQSRGKVDKTLLYDAIEFHVQAFSLYLLPYEARYYDMLNLSNTLLHLFRATRQHSLVEAQAVAIANIKSLPPDHPHLHILMVHLEEINQHFDKWVSYQDDRIPREYMKTAKSVSAPIVQRVWALDHLCTYALVDPDMHDEDAEQAFQMAIGLLPQLAFIGWDLESRYRRLSSIATVFACDGAAWVLRKGNIGMAVEWLEQGRSILWLQLLQFRQPFDDVVRESLPDELVRRAIDVANRMDRSEWENSGSTLERMDLATQWEAVIAEIRQYKGFEDFHRTLPFSELLAVGEEGPIILLTSSGHSPYDCDAIILGPKGFHKHVSIPNFKHDDVTNLHVTVSQSVPRRMGRVQEEKSGMQSVLEVLWNNVIVHLLPTLDSLGGERIWWCLTGAWVGLPMHAAGLYDQDGCNLPDRYISSYIPTLSSLINARRRNTAITVPRTLILDQSHELQEAKVETRLVQSFLPDGSTTRWSNDEAVVSAVRDILPSYSWVHFACHGHLNEGNPFLSGFKLWDGVLTLSDMVRATPQDPQFAFLSACSTAIAADRTPDESLHLSAAMQFLGYRSVVATLWPMGDAQGPIVTEHVYKHLTEKGIMDVRRASFALHSAVRALRDQGLSVEQWALFIHSGV
ncbi:CHAT domain-containing protein [Desarmillaria tabescens]|uniref:CHAT domain-containing protein n=1 Tax=Armillaria tabescens TaxID=1929756 RepID=A0AA39NC77_ARMTA|nr:CHAT domain-containing protein [Desarmillaria tabescens]KAK0462976.1 CHAT domain-containing protein [Desarmillaria tabescens]